MQTDPPPINEEDASELVRGVHLSRPARCWFYAVLFYFYELGKEKSRQSVICELNHYRHDSENISPTSPQETCDSERTLSVLNRHFVTVTLVFWYHVAHHFGLRKSG